MIETKEDLKFYLAADKFALGKSRKYPGITDEVWKYQILLRKVEFFYNNNRTIVNRVFLHFYSLRKHRLGLKLGFDIASNAFGPGLRINHYGNIVVHGGSKIGMWCDIHQGVNIGSNNSIEGRLLAPQIGSNVWIGPGAKIFGNIEIGPTVVVGANSVVNKNFDGGVTIAGVPAKIIKNEGTESINVTASRHRMEVFFSKNTQFEKYYKKY